MPKTKEITYTPGPWTIGRYSEHGTFNACNIYFGDRTIANVYGIPVNATLEDVTQSKKWTEGLANARLISAAPELLEALKRTRAILAGTDIEHVWINAPTKPSIGLGDMLDTVIAKAQGGS